MRKGNEELLNKRIYGFHHIQPVEIPIGVYRYEFQYQLPENLPYSFFIKLFGKDSSIEYIVKAILSTPYQLTKEACIQFRIDNSLDLNLHPSLRFGQNNEDSLDYCPLLCESGKILFFASIPVSGFAIGEKIPVDVSYSNGSNNRVLGTQIKLIQIIELRVFNSVDPDAKTEQTIMSNLFVFDKNQGKEINCRYLIDVPEGICLSNDHICSLIKVKYHLEVKSKTTSFGVSSKLTFPITIGTKKITGCENFNSQFTPTAPSWFDISSLDDTAEDHNLVASPPTYMDLMANSQQSNEIQPVTDGTTQRPSASSTVILHEDGSREIVMTRAVQLNYKDAEDADDQRKFI